MSRKRRRKTRPIFLDLFFLVVTISRLHHKPQKSRTKEKTIFWRPFAQKCFCLSGENLTKNVFEKVMRWFSESDSKERLTEFFSDLAFDLMQIHNDSDWTSAFKVSVHTEQNAGQELLRRMSETLPPPGWCIYGWKRMTEKTEWSLVMVQQEASGWGGDGLQPLMRSKVWENGETLKTMDSVPFIIWWWCICVEEVSFTWCSSWKCE